MIPPWLSNKVKIETWVITILTLPSKAALINLSRSSIDRVQALTDMKGINPSASSQRRIENEIKRPIDITMVGWLSLTVDVVDES